MGKIKAKFENGILIFGNHIVKKESDNFYAVYGRHRDNSKKLITSATTLKSAAKKAKLLELGFVNGYNCASKFYKEWYEDLY